MNPNPLISIIIATYNAGTLIEDTLYSILNQTYENYEILIIDAGSDSSTLTSIKKFQSELAYFVSEPDRGIYDAWNKGLSKAKGEWISFLGAGDKYQENALQNYVEYLSDKPDSVDFISSIIEIVDDKGKLISTHGKKWSWPHFLSNMVCAHVGALHSRRLFDSYGLFDISYRIAGDYEFLMRARNHLRTSFMPAVTVRMLGGGVSSNQRILKEVRRLKIESGKKSVLVAYMEYMMNWMKFQLRMLLRSLQLLR
jgi:glycosyltransferase involved in cell wall biosynthesis